MTEVDGKVQSMMDRPLLVVFAQVIFVALAGCGGGGSEADAEADAEADLEADLEADGDSEAGTDAELEAELEADLEAEADVEADVEDPVVCEAEGVCNGACGFGEDPDCSGDEPLPFEYERPAAGAPPTAEEVAGLTRAVTGFWRDVDYFRWVRMTSHGVDASTPEGFFDYALWWQDTQATREGDTVLFQHFGRADNLTLRTCKVLTAAIAGYMLTGDEDMRWIVEQYSRGIAALSMAMEFGPDDPHRYLQARALFTVNHSFATVGGRLVSVDYDPVRREEEAWNAAIIHNPLNPYWGDSWFVNQRSKDDVPHMYRAVPMLRRAARAAPDPSVREAAALALEYLTGFARDVVESGYQIRTRFDDGEPLLPTLETGAVKDLASFVTYEEFIPNAECNAKLSSALVGLGDPLDNDCGEGSGGVYEDVATTGHYFNYAIIRYFHIAAVHNALMEGENEVALRLLEGLAARADRMVYDEAAPNRDEPVYLADVAAFLLAAAAAGLPLTGDEARIVREQYLLSVEHYAAFDAWDPWAEELPQGDFSYQPDRGLAVRPTELGYLLEYCYSPLRNPAGAPVVDCDVIADRERWGE